MAPVDAKKRLALEVTSGLYPRAEAEEAQRYFESTFQRRQTPTEMQEYALPGGAEGRLDRVLVDAELVQSNAEARRMVQQGAVRINGERVESFDVPVHAGDEVRVGRRRFLRVTAG